MGTEGERYTSISQIIRQVIKPEQDEHIYGICRYETLTCREKG
jgi:hypothetical protein